MTKVSKALAKSIRGRAGNRCEYCHMPQEFERAPFQIEHIVAGQHGGPTTFFNLALACLRCNKHKGPNIAGRDPITGHSVFLFNPRQQEWTRHFWWNGPLLGSPNPGRSSDHRYLGHQSPLCSCCPAHPDGRRQVPDVKLNQLRIRAAHDSFPFFSLGAEYGQMRKHADIWAAAKQNVSNRTWPRMQQRKCPARALRQVLVAAT
jgi:hypothetical protein